MAKSMQKMLLLAAVETVPGTPTVPVPGSNAILTRNPVFNMIDGEQVERNLMKPYKGNSGKLFVGEHRKFTFEVELAGSGAAGTAPAWSLLLQACGFAETVTAGQDVTFNPVSEGEPTLTLYGYLDGNVSIELNAKQIPVMKFEFTGRYAPPTETGMPTGVDYSAFIMPKTVGKTNTPTFTFFGLNACTSAFSINWGNTVTWRDLINCAGAHSPTRSPTGNATIELPKADQANWAEKVRNSDVGSATLIHGVLPGNIIELQMPQLLPGIGTVSDDAGIAMLQLPFDLMPNQGDDELVIICR
jgi:hypothetical protein